MGDAARSARWLAEAWETGNPLGALPPEIAPASLDEAEEVAGEVLDALGLAPCGLRLVLRDTGPPLAGPLLAERILPGGATLARAALRHAEATAAVLGVLAEPLTPGEAAAPVFATLRPAIDVASSRFSDGPADDRAAVADLAGLGLIVAGRPLALAPGVEPVTLAEARRRPAGVERDLAAALALAAAEARRLGGLPAGAMLLVAGLSPAVEAAALAARIGRLGRVTATLA